MRLIDADALMQATCDWGICSDCEDAYKGQNVHANCSEIRLVFLRTINEAPTIDAVEVARGEWIDQGWHGDWQFETDGRGNCWYEYECSECGFRNKGSKSNYCPYCGAKMKGVDDETEMS